MKKIMCFPFLSIFFLLACSLTTPPSSVQDTKAQSVNKIYLATPTLIPTSTFNTIPAACTVTAQTLHLRNCAGLQCTVIAWLAKDEELVVHEKDHEWIKVTTPTGKTGWVHSKYCGGLP